MLALIQQQPPATSPHLSHNILCRSQDIISAMIGQKQCYQCVLISRYVVTPYASPTAPGNVHFYHISQMSYPLHGCKRPHDRRRDHHHATEPEQTNKRPKDARNIRTYIHTPRSQRSSLSTLMNGSILGITMYVCRYLKPSF